jgi:hypothetical protein
MGGLPDFLQSDTVDDEESDYKMRASKVMV